MKTAYTPPAPPAPEMCPGCRAFAPQCKVPAELFGGTGAPIALCWLCAHVACDHGGGAIDELWKRVGECGCDRAAIFPADVCARRDQHELEEPVDARRASMPANFGKPPKSQAMNARERSAKARAAASRTAIARRENALARRRAEVHGDRSEASGTPETESDRVDRVVAVRN